MFDALTSRVTGETWRKYRFAVEVGIAVSYAVIASTITARAFGSVAVLVPVASIVIVLHRVRPALALIGSGAISILVLVTFTHPFIAVWIPALAGVYGGVVYGGRLQRRLAIAIPPILILGDISSALLGYRSIGGWIDNHGVLTLVFAALAISPVVVGFLVRSAAVRRGESTVEPPDGSEPSAPRTAGQIFDELAAGMASMYWPLIEWAGATVFIVLCSVDFASRVGPNAALFVVPGAAVILLFRRHPAIALPLSGVVAVLVFVLGGETANYAMVIPGILAMFGSAAYGGRIVRWASLALPVLVVIGSPILQSVRNGRLIYLLIGLEGNGFLYVVYGALLLMAWLIGLVVQSRASRTSAQASERATAIKLDSAIAETMLAEERNRVAREVHDIVAHSLAVVIAQADGAKAVVAKNPDGAKESLGVIAGTAREALADIRVLLTELRHSEGLAPQPGFAELDGLVVSFRDAGLAIRRADYGTAGDASRTVQAAAYRILQEALTNALRHGTAAPVDLDLEWSEAALEITVSNDLEPDGVPSAGGHGVAGMRERAALVGGEFALYPGESGRFRVRARLPLEPRTALVPAAAGAELPA